MIALLIGCSSGGDGGAKAASAGSGSSSGVKKGSAGGFSAALSADLAKEGDSAAKPAEPAKTPEPAKPAARTIEQAKTAGILGTTDVGSAAKTPDRKPTTPDDPPLPAGKPLPPAGSASPPVAGTKRGPTKVPADLAAIKFDLEPNWDRDYDGAGTFGFELKIPNTQQTRVFVFRYGYDDPKAPADRDQYLKWIADSKVLSPTLNRQRGAAWYLEGADPSGVPVFRYLISYGGKHLICYGNQYKDAASNALGDLRDKVLMQAKKICETLTL